MKKALFVGVSFAAAIMALYAAFLAWRVVDERQHIRAAVRAALAHADPSIADISDARIAMLLRVEDPTFWTNDGIDLATPGAGFTTISQGVGKQLFFERFTPGLGKVELMMLTRFALVDLVPKRDILSVFLARAYLGDDASGPVIGFAEGARRWFGKELGALSDQEFLTLVAMLPAPNELDPVRHAEANAERVRRIERLLDNACAPNGLSDVELDGCA